MKRLLLVFIVFMIVLLGCQSGAPETVVEAESTQLPLAEAQEPTEDPETEPSQMATEEPQTAVVGPITDEHLFEAVSAADAAAVEQLLAAGANPDAIKPSGYPILKQAVLDSIKSHNTEIVTLLVENGADVNQLDGGGNAVLPLAAGARQLDVVRLFLDAGADVNGTSTLIITDVGPLADAPAVIHAVVGNTIEVLELLISHGADLDKTETSSNKTALHIAATLDRAKIIELLLENGANPDPPGNKKPLHFASEIHKVKSAQALLNGGADPNAQTEAGKTPLMYAVSLGKTSQFGSTGIVTLLLENGADPNLTDENGKTVLHYAAAGIEKDEAVRILIEHGASIDLQDNYGNTALHVAAKNGRMEVVSTLIEEGTSLDMQNEEGQTPLDVAKNEPVIELLQKAASSAPLTEG
jgi:ankyrin repeat protein